MRKNLLAALTVFVLIESQATAQNLVENPSFEDPTVSMGSANDVWFRFGTGALGTSSESAMMPRTGSRHIALELVGAHQFAGVFQNLNMTINPGDIVNFTGFAKNASDAPFNATQEIKLEWQGAPQNRLDALTLGSDYEMFSHTGVAPAGTTGLVVTYALSSFGAGQSGDSLVFLDDITVTIVPEPAAPGDTDADGDVDIADLNHVRNNFGAAGLPILGDTNADGIVNIEDLNAVRNNFGRLSEPVPEPTTMLLATCGLVAVTIVWRRRPNVR